MAQAHAERGSFRVRSRTAAWALERAYAVAPLALRLTLGPMLLAHGLQKLLAISAAAEGFGAMGVQPAMPLAVLVGIAEAFGGAAIILGLFTRFAVFVNLVVQTVALFLVHLPNGFFVTGEGGPGFEFNLINIGALLALLVLGAGGISIDHMLRRRSDNLETRRTAQIPDRTSPGTTPKGTRV